MSSIAQVEPLVYSISEAAQAMRLSRSMIRKLVHDQKLKASRIGDRVLIPLASLKELLEESAR